LPLLLHAADADDDEMMLKMISVVNTLQVTRQLVVVWLVKAPKQATARCCWWFARSQHDVWA